MTLNVSRRKFLQDSAAVGGGLVVGFHLPAAFAQGAKPAPTPQLNAWVVVRPDDTVIIRYARSEMGQGSMTSAAQLVAEELGADWKKVRVEYASTNEQVRLKRPWGDMAAVGSRTIRMSQEYLRKGGATAREMLVAAAARKWNVPVSACVAASNVITHVPSGRKTSFGSVAAAAAKLEPPKDVSLKDPKDWTIAGKPVPRVDIPDTVMGRQRYGIDAQVPGMVYAAIAQCPVFGGKVKSYDAAKIKGRRGILNTFAIDNDAAIVVVADNWWRAKEALKDVAIVWDDAGNGAVSSASIMEFLKAGFNEESAVVAKRTGDVDKALAEAAKVVQAEYYTPYLAHSTLEPQTCTALIKDGRVDVWTSTQNAEASHATAAAAAGVPLENVYVHRMQLGGGFGRRGGAQDFVRQGVLVAKVLAGTPVKLLWTREEDTQHDFYRPASLIRLKAGLDAAGNPVALWTRVSAPSIIATLLKLPLKDGVDPQAVAALGDLPFSIPNVRVEYAQRNPHVPVGFWRTVGHSQNPFVRESFVDEMAQATGKDPYEFRRALLGGAKRDLAILDTTAAVAGWGKPLPAGVFRGIAETEAYGSYTACVAEVSANAKREIAIHRIVVGLDCGHMVNPDNTTAQIQGSVVYALSALFWGDITIKDGRVEQSNFHDYRLMRLAEMPKVEVVLAPTGGFWGGVGEPANAPVAPAVCNAIFAATGERVRSHPLNKQGFSLGKA
ncbi:MAG TPA: molybdopterin cofactor-binding domain-containing protein [Burkholderiales bacterium]|nr:molybdopterin cofactor-binding domain-containing protein [Burkholderiales bacterium]